MEKFICIHGHFYQPPRENPWLEAIEPQDSAAPFHDWNERITEECYLSNASARILDEHQQIVKIVNNYSSINFNFGPTLLSWLEKKHPDVYQKILTADRESQKKWQGHGNAMAQCYHHLIMPLANKRDKYTEVFWGIADFEQRFKRKPKGMWLPETAVDLETLEIMAELGIEFTVLAPNQAHRVKKFAAEEWQEVAGGCVDARRPYYLALPNGKSMTIFFYDGAISQAIAFSGLLNNGEELAKKIATVFTEHGEDQVQLATIATDGETYGHHHAHGDMALAYAIEYIETKQLAKITNFSYFLSQFPPLDEVQIYENSSWSCIHGIKRWSTNCGCNSGNHRDWQQQWRAPLRAALDWLRDKLADLYEEKARALFTDCWDARNNYIAVVNDRSTTAVQDYLAKYASHVLNEEEKIRALILLEMQRHSLMMYTSCGWFFDEVSGIETVQILSYAAKVIELAEKLGITLEAEFRSHLIKAPSNLVKFKNASIIYDKLARVTMKKVADIVAIYAVNCLFKTEFNPQLLYNYHISNARKEFFSSGKFRLLCGEGVFTDKSTMEAQHMVFTALYLGEQIICCGVSPQQVMPNFMAICSQTKELFHQKEIAEIKKIINKEFSDKYALQDLLHEEQYFIIQEILAPTVADVDQVCQQIFSQQSSLLNFIKQSRISLPMSLKIIIGQFINSQLHNTICQQSINIDALSYLISLAKGLKVNFNKSMLAYPLQKSVERQMKAYQENSTDTGQLQQLILTLRLVDNIRFDINLFMAQNMFYEFLQQWLIWAKNLSNNELKDTTLWRQQIITLGKLLSVKVL